MAKTKTTPTQPQMEIEKIAYIKGNLEIKYFVNPLDNQLDGFNQSVKSLEKIDYHIRVVKHNGDVMDLPVMFCEILYLNRGKKEMPAGL